jgi:hypothetical protein
MFRFNQDDCADRIMLYIAESFSGQGSAKESVWCKKDDRKFVAEIIDPVNFIYDSSIPLPQVRFFQPFNSLLIVLKEIISFYPLHVIHHRSLQPAPSGLAGSLLHSIAKQGEIDDAS